MRRRLCRLALPLRMVLALLVPGPTPISQSGKPRLTLKPGFFFLPSRSVAHANSRLSGALLYVVFVQMPCPTAMALLIIRPRFIEPRAKTARARPRVLRPLHLIMHQHLASRHACRNARNVFNPNHALAILRTPTHPRRRLHLVAAPLRGSIQRTAPPASPAPQSTQSMTTRPSPIRTKGQVLPRRVLSDALEPCGIARRTAYCARPERLSASQEITIATPAKFLIGQVANYW